MTKWSLLVLGCLGCSDGRTLGDMHVRGERTGLFEHVNQVWCSMDSFVVVTLRDRRDRGASYRIELPVPPDGARHPALGTLSRELIDGPIEFERSVPVYADLALGDPIGGEQAVGDVVYVHRLVVPRNGDLFGTMDQVVLGCL